MKEKSYYKEKDYYQLYIAELKIRISDYLKSENVEFDENKNIEELAKIADEVWKTSKKNSRRKPSRTYQKHDEKFLKELKDYYQNHTRKETAEHFNISYETVIKYVAKYKLKHPKEFTSILRSMSRAGNMAGLFNRGQKRKNVYKGEKVDPSVFKNKIIKFR